MTKTNLEKEMKYCKLSDYAKKYGVTYRTAFNRYNAGKLEGAVRDATGHICVPIEYLNGPISNNVVIYATVNSNKEEDLNRLEEQVKTLTQYCNSRGYHIDKIVREIANSIEGDRPKFTEILKDRNAKHIVIERESSVTRFGFSYISTLLETDQRQIEAMNNFEEEKEPLVADTVRYIYSICKTLGGRRLPKKNIKILINKLCLGIDVDYIDEL